MAGPNDMVRISNKGETTFKDMYASITYTIKPDSDGFVPWDAACCWLGNPSLVDAGREKPRTDAYELVRIRYGAYQDEAAFEVMRPKVEVYSLDGDRIIMIADDPYDINQAPPAFTQTTVDDPLAARLNAMQEQLNALMDGISTLTPEQQQQVVKVARGTRTDPSPTGDTNTAQSTPAPKSADEKTPTSDTPPVDKPTRPKTTSPTS